MKSVAFLLTAGLLLSFSASSAGKGDSMLDKLDNTLRMRSTYESYFEARIQNLKSLRQAGGPSAENILVDFKIAEEYSTWSLDSTLLYLDRIRKASLKIGRQEYVEYADMFLVYAYTKAACYFEAQELLRSYDPETLSGKSRDLYFLAAHKLASEIGVYSKNACNFLEEPGFYREYLLAHTEKDTYAWYDLMREEMRCRGDTEEERKYAERMLSSCREGTNQYATAAYFMSMTWQDENSDEKLQWLIRSAVSDILSSTRDYESLNSIAYMMFMRGDIERAFKYTADYCLPDALFYNGKLRPLQIAHFFSEIEQAYQRVRDRENKALIAVLIALTVMAVVLAVLIITIFSRNKALVEARNKLQESKGAIESRNAALVEVNSRLSALNARLKETDKVKEEYISLFLSILSENIDTTRKYKNHVLKNIRKGNVGLIEEEIENLPPIDEDIDQFYKMFDSTFINMYPDFVEKFNSLLAEGEEVYPKNADDLLSPEQRIFALIKLGITDSSKIAALLHYSTNTIYNYKAKIKNKARGDRNLFEERLCSLI